MKLATTTGRGVLTLFRKACLAHATPFALQCELAVRQNRLATHLKECAPDPASYTSLDSFSGDWLLANLLKKSPLLPGLDKKARLDRAYRSWKAAEVRCASTNRKIAELRKGSCAVTGITVNGSQNVGSIILSAQRKVLSLLGDSPPLEYIAACGRWSNGATATKKRGTSIGAKVSVLPSVTRSAYRLAAWMMSEDYAWLRSLGIDACGPCSPLQVCFDICDHNRLEMVPKSAYTDRAICAEPDLNAFMQQGVGRFIRRVLKRVGVDLDDQSWNQRLAAIAEVAELATLDLEGASDSVCYALVELLLPHDWFVLLDALRCDVTSDKGLLVRLAKFSSMGNAFTFELESLIFWALSESVVEATSSSRLLAIYGDDIIVPQESAQSLVLVLNELGFVVNREKSFLKGSFFESCGVHYFQGKDVTPLYSKTRLVHLSESIRLYNAFVRWCYRVHGSWGHPIARPFMRALWVPDSCQVPWIDGDDGFITPLDNFVEDIQRGYRCKVLTAVSNTVVDPFEAGLYAYKLRNHRFSNVGPKGHTAQSVDRWVYRETWIPHWRVHDAAIEQYVHSTPRK